MKLEEHPLFPRDPSDKAANANAKKTIGQIILKRRVPGGPNETYPQSFAPEDLTSLAFIHERWGGGTYEFIARAPEGHILDRHTETLALGPGGKTLPFVPTDGGAAGAPAAAAPAATPGGLAIATTIAAIVTPIATLIVHAMQQSAEREARREDRLEAARRDDAERSRQMAAQQAQFMMESQARQTEMMARYYDGMAKTTAGASGGGVDQFMRTLELGLTLGAKGQGSSEIEDVVAMLGGLGMAGQQLAAGSTPGGLVTPTQGAPSNDAPPVSSEQQAADPYSVGEAAGADQAAE